MTRLPTPRIEINLAKIAHNAKKLVQLYGSKGIEIMAVTKGVCGSPEIAKIFLNQGIQMLADSKLINLKRMRDAGISAQFVLLRSPALSEIEAVIKYADISINTELSVIKKLSETAKSYNTVQKIILMIEMGDLREGIMPENLEMFIQEVLKLSGVKIEGIGANFACFGGVKPSEEKMDDLSTLASEIEMKFSLPLSYVSGGNSANYNWFMATKSIGKINNLRVGESFFLGRETLNRLAIPELYTDAFTFVTEVIESKTKPSVPFGELGQNAFGDFPQFEDRGQITRAILGAGNQDVLVTGLLPILDFEILGSSSDHIVLDAKKMNFSVGDEVTFNLTYGALLSTMTSPYVFKKYIHSIEMTPSSP
ncbi:alanine/ornithine racemase family PLP-dependent enzyme [Peribacillus cavernae]|uniref:Alanine/ornithine racemase family PLP-dependent enzyme n=1 Tax=Peribacillus cavernae TaxID=1674310 RepID=A0A433HTA8_9BACI|nr:alanine/ornithine racemase family PLP-dependent enzyme [Peribacillus cavernae]MDQ0218571.1 putative amino acid racemase [Peribacillus cavernae]RUQ31560.1 alanine/ornithine racemase family PLP-dependent enzyme [Peribacillus cavernae]